MTYRVFDAGDGLPGVHPDIAPSPSSTCWSNGLVGACDFGGDLNLSLSNRANPRCPYDPWDQTSSATLQHENRFDTLLTPSASRTWIVIYKPRR